MKQFHGVANTLYVPLVARISVSKEFPEYFYDEKAVELEKNLPEGVGRGASQYSNMASVARYYTMDKMAKAFIRRHDICNLVYLGIGFETAYDRLCSHITGRKVNWFEVDLPEVIDARKKIFGERKEEILIAGDMFQLQWINQIDTMLPTLIIVSGVFQYFHEDKIIPFVHQCIQRFPQGELIFDATSKSGLKFTNWFIKRTGNKDALMYFYVDDSREFVQKCGAVLLGEKTFFPDALRILKNKLSPITKVSMRIAEQKKQVLILHLGFSPHYMPDKHHEIWKKSI